MSYQQSNGVGPGLSDDRQLFVGRLGRNINEKELRDYFSKYGEIENVSIKADVYTGRSRGFAFIKFKNAQTIDELLNAGDHYIGSKKVKPKRVRFNPLSYKIFVGGLSSYISDDDLISYFGQYGEIAELRTPFDKVFNQRRGYCIITFKSTEVVQEVLKNPKQTINGKEVHVRKVKFNPETMGAGGRGGKGAMFGGRGGSFGDYAGGYDGYGMSYSYYGGYGGDYGGGYDVYEMSYSNYGGDDRYGMSYSNYGGDDRYGMSYSNYGGYGGYGDGYNYYAAQPNYQGGSGGKFRDNRYQRYHPY